MTSNSRVDTPTTMLALSLLVIGLLVGIGILRVFRGEPVGSLLRYFAITVILLVFSIALYRQWRDELVPEMD